MSENILLVKNMVCHRCLLAVENILEKTSIKFKTVTTGEIHLREKISADQHSLLSSGLVKIGLELINSKITGLTEKIKQLLIRKARGEASEAESRMSLSAFLTQNLYHEYTYLSSLFSSFEGRTIESYFIQQRVEKVKELLLYTEMTLLTISVELNYSSVAHLSNQFKQVTGFTPSDFRKDALGKRKLLGEV